MGDHRSASADSRALLGAPGGGMVRGRPDRRTRHLHCLAPRPPRRGDAESHDGGRAAGGHEYGAAENRHGAVENQHRKDGPMSKPDGTEEPAAAQGRRQRRLQGRERGRRAERGPEMAPGPRRPGRLGLAEGDR